MRRGDIAAAIRFEVRVKVREHMTMCTAAPASDTTRRVIAAEKFNMAFEVSLEERFRQVHLSGSYHIRAIEIVNARKSLDSSCAWPSGAFGKLPCTVQDAISTRRNGALRWLISCGEGGSK
jgi:hypothetical protein